MSEKFERQKLVYKENASQMRALNEQMSKVPAASVTLTGGLWFAAAHTESDLFIKFGILIFTGLANIALIAACLRIRDVMQSYLEKMREFYSDHFVSGMPKKPVAQYLGGYSMISIYSFLMLAAAFISFGGAFSIYWPFDPAWRIQGVAFFFIFIVIVFVAVAFLLSSRE